MRIKSLQIQDFRGVQRLHVDLAPVTVIVGPNGSGKTSIAWALEQLLTGRCPGTDDRGAGADGLVRNGSTGKGSVSAMIDAGIVSRMVPGGMQVTGWTGASTAQETELLNRMGVDKDLVRCAIQAGRFVTLPGEEQRQMLFKLLKVPLDQISVGNHLKALAKELGQQPDALIRALVAIWPTGPKDLFKALEKGAGDKRAGANRSLAEARKRLELHGVTALPEGVTAEDRDALETQLREVKAQKDTFLRKQGEAAGAAKRKRDLAEDLERTTREYTGTPVVTVPNLTGLESAVARTEAAYQQAAKKAQAMATALTDLQSQRRTLASALEAFKKVDTCPLAPVKCAQKPSVVPELESRIAELDKQIPPAQTAKTEADGVLQAADLARKNAVSAMSDGKNAAMKAEAREKLGERVKRLELEFKALPAVEDSTKLEADIATLTERVSKGERLVGALAEQERTALEHENFTDAVTTAEREAVLWEAMVQAMSPAGVRARILNPVVNQLAKQVNAVLADLSYETLQVTVEAGDEFSIMCRNSVKNTTLPLKALCESEAMRVGLAFADVLNAYTNLGLLVLDRAEALDPVNKKALINVCLELAPRYGNIIILAVQSDVPPTDPGIEGLAVYTITDGVVERAPAPEAAAV